MEAKINNKRTPNYKLIKKLRLDEKKITKKSYQNFSKRIKKVGADLNFFVNKNSPIACYGASTKGNIVLNYCNLDSKKIEYICDANKKKIRSFYTWHQY